MHIQEGAQLKTKGGVLWRRAPVWRWSLIGAVICTGLLVFVQQMPDPTKIAAPPQVAHAPQKVAPTPSTTAAPPSSSVPVGASSAANTPPTNVAVTPTVHTEQPEKKTGRAASPAVHVAHDRHAAQRAAPTSNEATENHSDTKAQPAPESKPRAVGRAAEAAQPTEQPQANACGTQTPEARPPLQHYVLKVIGFMPRSEALALLELTQKQAGMRISPRYVDNQRVMLAPIAGQAQRYTVALLPQGMQVKVGDMVDITSGFKLDPQYPCNYIPNLIDHVVATAAPPLTPGLVSQDTAKTH